ncbi:hypothetical protein CFOL_v3_22234 [Cephalotus follicularis]|uniref:IQ domain-containing protein/DUF4005 domain-containing protein n=1 Tax=Cephalotus follicularis TaxID=3775 RepID=A0A1Q3CEV9_CEPFO|nr:hypothetical protein CFOL_v3_22234 [Cephalotus follicularis]
MGSGDWFKTIISLRKGKGNGSKQLTGTSASAKLNGFRLKKNRKWKGLTGLANGSTGGNPGVLGVPVEDLAAIRIQTAFRAYVARKVLRRLKGIVRLQILTQNLSIKKQPATTLSYLHSWSKMQTEIRARRIFMVTEGRIKQKKLENQLKLEGKLHDLEVEWSSGAETMDKTLARIHNREAAAVKRERTMAYAFSHQWRANCNHKHGPDDKELSKANWGWSWKDRWIAARPWESRVPSKSISPKKVQSKQANMVGTKSMNSDTPKASVSVKPPRFNGKGIAKPRRMSYPGAEKPAAHKGSTKPEDISTKKMLAMA